MKEKCKVGFKEEEHLRFWVQPQLTYEVYLKGKYFT